MTSAVYRPSAVLHNRGRSRGPSRAPRRHVRVLHVNPTFYPSTRDGGPSESLLLLVRGLRTAGIDAEIATTNGDGPTNSDVPIGTRTAYEGVPVTYFERVPRIGYAPSPGLLRHLARAAHAFDLVHVHALFNFPSTFSAALLRTLGVPYVLSPRGMCEPWALAHRPWKKQPYYHLVERANLRGSRLLHATSDEEARNLRDLVPSHPVAIVPNAVELPRVSLEVVRAPERIVFLGRLHPVKGLDVLVPAVSLLAKRRPTVELVLAGPNHHGELERIERLAATLSPRPRLRWLGEVHGDAKSRLLAEATVLALTSYSESFGRTVVEALAHGTPVVVSKQCPWSVVAERGAGHWVDNTPEAVAEALFRVLEAHASGAAMHVAARGLAAEFGVDEVGAKMAGLYRDALASR
jgi:glycosyltransferase involved in cell wall biosynthesis